MGIHIVNTLDMQPVGEAFFPAGHEFMRETPELVRGIGGAASEFSEVSIDGSSDADGTETTASVDPGTMDPFTLSDAVVEFTPDVTSLN